MYKNNLHEPEVIRNLNSEIKRYDIINYLIEKYKLINYLEIGVFQGENIRKVKAPYKDGVDPGHEGYVVPEVTYPMTSDNFFGLIKDHEDIKYDIIFIDGLHHADQVDKDIANALEHVIKDGFIVLHDCNPISYEAQLIPRETIVWNGDVWKSFVNFRLNYPSFKTCVIDTDFGIGIIQNNSNYKKLFVPNFKDIINDWDHFSNNREELLNLVTVEKFKQLF
jgi:hypothetical protein